MPRRKRAKVKRANVNNPPPEGCLAILNRASHIFSAGLLEVHDMLNPDRLTSPKGLDQATRKADQVVQDVAILLEAKRFFFPPEGIASEIKHEHARMCAFLEHFRGLIPRIIKMTSGSSVSRRRLQELWETASQLSQEVADCYRCIQKLPNLFTPGQQKRLAKTSLFIGSASEDLPAAETLERLVRNGLGRKVNPRVWTKIFTLGETPIESLETVAATFDFAIFVCSPRDRTTAPGRSRRDVIRDNITFEIGLFIGTLTRKRVFLVVPKGCDRAKMFPSDMMGITTTAGFEISCLGRSLKPTVKRILEAVKSQGPRL